MFFINVPIGLVATALAMHVILRGSGFSACRFDIRGTVTLFISMVCVLYVIKLSPSHGFDALSLALLAVFVVNFRCLSSSRRGPRTQY